MSTFLCGGSVIVLGNNLNFVSQNKACRAGKTTAKGFRGLNKFDVTVSPSTKQMLVKLVSIWFGQQVSHLDVFPILPKNNLFKFQGRHSFCSSSFSSFSSVTSWGPVEIIPVRFSQWAASFEAGPSSIGKAFALQILVLVEKRCFQGNISTEKWEVRNFLCKFLQIMFYLNFVRIRLVLQTHCGMKS